MNLLRLLKMLLSPKFVREIFLFIQVAIMVVFLNIILIPFETEFQLFKSIENSFSCDVNKIIHFNPNASFFEPPDGWSDKVFHTLKENKGIGDILQIEQTVASFDVENKKLNSNFFIYSDALFKENQIDLREGKFISYLQNGKLPIIISSSLSDELPLDAELTLTVPYNNGNNTASISCVVTGIIETGAALPAINFYGSFPSMDVLGVRAEPNNGYDFIVTAYNQCLQDYVNWGSPMLIISDDSASSVNELNSNYSDYGTFMTFNEIKAISMTKTINENQFNILMFVLFCPIVLFGYGGYVLITLQQRKKEFGIFFILGLSRRKLILLNFIIGVIVLTLAVCAGMIITPILLDIILKILFKGYGVANYVLIIILFVVTYLISIIVGYVQTRLISSAALYREVD